MGAGVGRSSRSYRARGCLIDHDLTDADAIRDATRHGQRRTRLHRELSASLLAGVPRVATIPPLRGMSNEPIAAVPPPSGPVRDESAFEPFTVARVSAWPDDKWPLTGPYVEGVWLEILGPTATLLARRVGRMVDERRSTVVSLVELGASLGVSETKVVSALQRLHMHHLVVFAPDRLLIGVSGFAPSVRPGQQHRLSRAGLAEHARLVAERRRQGAQTTVRGRSDCAPAGPEVRSCGRSL